MDTPPALPARADGYSKFIYGCLMPTSRASGALSLSTTRSPRHAARMLPRQAGSVATWGSRPSARTRLEPAEPTPLQRQWRSAVPGALARLDCLNEIDYTWIMKLTVQIQLLPDAQQSRTLRAIVERFNEACNWIAAECFARNESNQFRVRKFAYKQVRDRFGLSSQMAQLAIKVVCDAYKRDKSIKPKFRKHAAIVYDQRTMSFKGPDRVSLLTLTGRELIPYVMGKYQAEQFTHAKGQADLILRDDGKWFLLVTVDVPDTAPIPTTNFMGVDFGVVNIAMTEDGEKFSGEKIDATRRHYGQRRKGWAEPRVPSGEQASDPRTSVGPRNEPRQGKPGSASTRTIASPRRSWKPPRAPDAESALKISKGFATESRLGAANSVIGSRVGLSSSCENSWNTRPRWLVCPWSQSTRNTSRTCPECGHCEKTNRKSQSEFECRACGHRSHADLVGARIVGSRARASVTAPKHAGPVPA